MEYLTAQISENAVQIDTALELAEARNPEMFEMVSKNPNFVNVAKLLRGIAEGEITVIITKYLIEVK